SVRAGPLSMLAVGAVRWAGLARLTGQTGLAVRVRRFRLLGTLRVGSAALGELGVQLRLGRGHQFVHRRDRAGDGRAAGRESAALQLDQGGLPGGNVLIERKVRAGLVLRAWVPRWF